MTELKEPTNISPQGSRQWVEFLREKSLPVRNSVLMRLQKKLHDPNASLHEIGQIVRADPALCLAVVQTASLRHQAVNSRVTGLEHAVNSLGINQLSALRYQLTPHRLNPNSVAQKMYFRTLANSHLAAFQCRLWLQQKKTRFLDESWLASLFFGVGYWFLWQHAAHHMSEIQIRIREHNYDPQLAENDVLGCTVDQISHGLLRAWGVSELAQAALEHDEVSNHRFMRQLHRRALDENSLSPEARREVNLLILEKFFPVKLANWLSQSIDLGWNRPRAMQVVDMVNDYLKGEIGNTLSELHQGCVRAARQYHVPGTLAPAAEMLLLPSNHSINYRLSHKEQQNLSLQPQLHDSAAVTASQPDDSSTNRSVVSGGNRQYLERAMQRLQQAETLFNQPKQILRELLQALNSGVGFDRAALFVINPRHHSLKTAFTLGFPNQHPISGFSFDYHIPSLLRQLSEQQKSICVRAHNRDKALHFLPESYQQWAPENGFALLSVFNQQTPVAIIHVDHGMTGNSIDETQQQAAAKLARAASAAITQLQPTRSTTR